ncbi:nucleotidyltransferase family protein [Paenibacillus lautus]|uniref:nucleotidyltransferase family protein n=1 Tax=Paenibacillus lautus TaxID=1401 RepID=UPI000BBDDE29|nr:nucleotidyltransferase family protein [Paenibacillus lautus]PCL90079.1 hypothetical protein CPZ30_26395 [Paenibacillus lautus]
MNLNYEKRLILKVTKKILEGDTSIFLGEDPHLTGIDWNAFYSLASHQKILPIVYRVMHEVIPAPYSDRFMERSQYIRYKNKLMFQELKGLTAADKGRSMFVLKGVVLSQILYDDPFIRTSHDIDILIDEKNLYQVDQTLKEQGFVPACGKSDVYSVDYNDFEVLPYPILKTADSHEYFSYIKMVESKMLIIEVQRCIHETISPERMEQFLRNEEDVWIEGIEVHTLDLVHTLLYLVESVHTDAGWYYRGPRLNKYLEIGLFIKKFEDRIDWQEVTQEACTYGIIDIMNSVFDSLQELFEMALPKIKPDKNNENGGENTFTVHWDKPLTERFFQSTEERQSEIFRKIKTQCYLNSTSSEIHRLGYAGDVLQRASLKLRVSDGKDDYNLEYLPVLDDEYLIFNLFLPDEIKDSSFDWEVILNLIDTQIDSDILDLQTISFMKKEGSITATNHAEGIVEFSLSQNSEVRILIPRPVVKFSKDGLLAYKLIVRKRIYGEIYYSISSDGYADKNFWLSPLILQLPNDRECADDTGMRNIKAI